MCPEYKMAIISIINKKSNIFKCIGLVRNYKF